MVGLSNVAQALGILAGGAMEGYAKGAMHDIMAKREAYMDQLKAQREAQLTAEDRAFRSGEAEKEREFKRELVGEEREWEKEKLGLQEASHERRLRLSASLRPRGGGGKGSGGGGVKATALINEARQVLKGELGRDATDAEVSAYVREMRAKGGTSGGDKEPTALKLARFKAVAKYGKDATDAQVAEFLGRDGPEKKVSLSDVSKLDDMAWDEVDPGEVFRLSPTQEMLDKKEAAKKRLADQFGIDVPGSRGARPAEESPQESVAEVEQPGVLDAPATSTKGDDTTGFEPPRGQGNKASPYMAETEEQAEWAVKNASPGSWVVFRGQLFQVEGKK
jgi:hypothetical protein